MDAAAYIAIVNLLTSAITRILAEAKGAGVDVDSLLAKYEAAHAEAMAYTPRGQQGP